LERINWELVYSLLAANAVIGFLFWARTWYRIRRFRNVVEERDHEYKEFRKNDVKEWSTLKLLFGAMTILIPRAIIFFLVVLVACIISMILLIG
jgi:hypothetical protein